MKRGMPILLSSVVLGLAGTVYVYRGEIGVALMRRVAAKSIFSDTVSTLPDGLHVGFWGTGSPFPSPTRSGPCSAIIAVPRLFIVDAGRGSADIIARMGLQSGRIEAVLLTHFHPDHIDGLGQVGEVAWASGRNAAAHLFHDSGSFHTSPSDAADEASQARVHALALTHFIPPAPTRALGGPFLA